MKIISLFELITNEDTQWIPLIVPTADGYLSTSKGTWQVDPAAIYALWQYKGNDILIDYEHQGLPDEHGNRKVAPAAGWIKELRIDGGAIYARVEWLAKAAEYIKAQEYKYLSPAILINDEDVVVGLDSVALVNNPATYSAIPVALSTQYAEYCVSLTSPDEGAINIKNSQSANMEGRYMSKILALLGLAADATEQAIMDAFDKLRGSAELATAALSSLGLPADTTVADMQKSIVALSDARAKALKALGLSDTASIGEMEGKIVALSGNTTQLSTLQADVAKLNAELKKRDANELVQVALSSGKIAPAQKDWAIDYAINSPDGFRKYVETAVAVVPLSGGLTPAPKDESGLTSVDKDVMAACGVSADDYAKYGKK